MAAVGRLSIRPSKLASEDLPELDSPQMARRNGRSRRCCVRRSARTAEESFEPGGIALSNMLRASVSSATIRPVSGWSDTTSTSLGLPLQAASIYQGNAPRRWLTSLSLRSAVMHRLPGENAQRRAGDLVIAERLDARVRPSSPFLFC